METEAENAHWGKFSDLRPGTVPNQVPGEGIKNTSKLWYNWILTR